MLRREPLLLFFIGTKRWEPRKESRAALRVANFQIKKIILKESLWDQSTAIQKVTKNEHYLNTLKNEEIKATEVTPIPYPMSSKKMKLAERPSTVTDKILGVHGLSSLCAVFTVINELLASPQLTTLSAGLAT